MVSVIPVLGMGGVGKTALAQVVYNEPSVRKHFQHRGWLCISDHFDVLDITRKIIKSFTGETVESAELDELQDTLNQELKGRRFLLVLDDVWNDEPAPWESLKAPLLSAGHGKVIVTTRNASVAKIMQTVPPLQLGNLSFQDSWTLFENLAFGRRRPDAHANLAEMGEKIVERCKGLPLAIKVLGCILGNEHEEEETWAEIVESQLWEIDEEKDEILPALKLSYDRMPAHLKRCFMYLSLFPKNYPIEKERIVRLWMAQGLLQKGDDGDLEEDSGYAYIDEMLQRSILQYPDGEETDEFIMHDLIHDLAQRVAGGEYLRIAAHEASEIPKQQVRHLSLVFKNVIELKYLQPVLESKLLRTLLIVFVGAGVSYDTFELDAQNALFEKLKFLRALDLYHFNMRELADSIGGLRHLRYLRLQDIKSFPESICELHNLQVIEIDSMELPELPRGVGNLINLRHLVVDGDTTCTPYEVGELTNLQTLQNVRVDPWHCSLGQLKDLVNLRGTLKIDFLDNLLPFPGAPINEKYLRSKKRLATLSLRWKDEADGGKKCSHFSNLRVPHDDDDGVDDKGAWQLADHVLLESLEPNANLGYLQIVGYKGSSFPRWLGYDSFSNLETLLLTACPNCEFLPPLGQLPSLKHLMIEELGRVASVGREFCALDPPPPALSSSKRFRSLEYLQFVKMDKWTAWHGVDSSDFPCLRKLEIDNCEELRELPECLCSSPTTRLEALGLSGCPNLNGIPEHLFSSLVELSIQSTPNVLTAAPSLPMLQSLLVMESRELSVLDLHGLPLLRVLSISDCSGLRSLSGLGILASLWDLRFDDCPRLQISEHDTLPPSLERVCILKSPGAKNWYRTQKMCSANQSHPEEEFSEEDADSEIKQLGEEEEKYFDMEELGAGGNDGASEGTEELDEGNEMKEPWRGEEEEEEEEDNDNEDVEEESGEFVSSDSTVAAASSGCKRQPVQFLKHKKKRT